MNTRRRGSRFYLLMATLLLVINLVGFAPTYFLAGLFDVPSLPLRTHVHGLLFTSWFVLLLVQAALIRRGDVRLHRRLGTLGGVLAATMVLSGLVILYYGAGDFRRAGGDLARTSQFLWGNLTLTVAFATFVVLAIVKRNRPESHRRLMLLASLSMMGQALARLGRFPALQIGDSPLLSEAIYGLGGQAALLGLLVGHDLWTNRRVHPTVAWGAPLLLVSILTAGLVIPMTGFGQGLARLLY